VHSSNNEHVNSFALLYGVVANQHVGGGTSDVIVTYNFSVYFSAHFRRFVSIYTVFIINDPIKNLSGQDIENLIELYRLERCLWDSSDADYLDAESRQAALQRSATELGRGITFGRPLARNYP